MTHLIVRKRLVIECQGAVSGVTGHPGSLLGSENLEAKESDCTKIIVLCLHSKFVYIKSIDNVVALDNF